MEHDTGLTVADEFADEEARFAAVRRRDRQADGRFYYSVATTGVYCFPSCAARPALRHNMAFHATPQQAERAGFRPCRRCRPDLPPRAEREAATVSATCRQIEQAEDEPSLAELAAHAGLSPHYFHRLFRRVTGVTPKAYASAHRQARVQNSLSAGAAVTEAIYDAGFNSSGRFYEASAAILGMTASHYRAGGRHETIRYGFGQCSLGAVAVAAAERGICAILLGDTPAVLLSDLRARFPQALLEAAGADFEEAVGRVVTLVDHPHRKGSLGLPLDIRGTAFQRRVWEVLRRIPAGQTLSYRQVAVELGSPSAVRAVAGACAANVLAVAIPCHRVVAADGRLAGYRWGTERKRRLLDEETSAQTQAAAVGSGGEG